MKTRVKTVRLQRDARQGAILVIALVAIIGIVFFGDELSPLRVLSFLLVIAGVVGLNLGRVAH